MTFLSARSSIGQSIGLLSRLSNDQIGVSTLRFGTMVHPDLLDCPAVADAIEFAMPAGSALQMTMAGWYEIVDIRGNR